MAPFILAGTLTGTVGLRVVSAVHRVEEILGCAVCIALGCVRPSTWNAATRADLSRQIYYGGIGAVPFMTVVSLLVGAGLVFQLLYWLSLLGESGFAERFVVLVLARELVPLLVALVYAGRSGMAILAETGGLQQGGQIRLLEQSGVSTFDYLLPVRAIGGLVSMLGLSLMMLSIALLAGITLSNLTGATDRTADSFFIGILMELDWVDALVLLVKPALFSLAIVAICGGRGLALSADDVDVARQLPAAFTECVLAVFILSGLILIFI